MRLKRKIVTAILAAGFEVRREMKSVYELELAGNAWDAGFGDAHSKIQSAVNRVLCVLVDGKNL